MVNPRRGPWRSGEPHNMLRGPRKPHPRRFPMPAPQARPLVHPDITPSSSPELASHYIDAPNMPWEPTKFPGIRIKALYSDDSGITTALFRLDPGAVVP